MIRSSRTWECLERISEDEKVCDASVAEPGLGSEHVGVWPLA